ncbi:MAG: protein kinase [Bryobacterales bacterium]|nr:protein kinase [Bryobacterales bacterium]
MSTVYKARDHHPDRFVALKVLRADKIADDGRRQRFIRAAKAASALNHPNIVTIYDIGSDNGVDFIAMEFIAGRTLDAILLRQGLRIEQISALAKAHSAGILLMSPEQAEGEHFLLRRGALRDGDRPAGFPELYARVDAGGGDPQGPQAGDCLGLLRPIFSPDGKQVLFVGGPSSNAASELDWWVTPASGGPSIKTGLVPALLAQGLSFPRIGPRTASCSERMATSGRSKSLRKAGSPRVRRGR